MRKKNPKATETLVFLFWPDSCAGPALACGPIPSEDTEWPTYAGDLAGTRYRPLDQINASISAIWKSPGASRPTISATARSTSSKAHRS